MDPQIHKVFLKMHQIARFRVRAHKDAAIAQHFGLSLGGFARIVGTPEYKEIEASVLEAVLGRLDASASDDVMKLRQQFSAGLPAACQALIDTVKQDKDLRAKLDAARELLDRDPNRTLSKDGGASATPGQRPLPTDVLAQLNKDNATVVDDFSRAGASSKAVN